MGTPEPGPGAAPSRSVGTLLNLALLALFAAITLAGFLLVPEGRQLPVHWGLNGQVDATLPRNLALLQMPLAVAAVWLVTLAINRWGNAGRSAAAAAGLRLVLPGLTVLFSLIQLVIVLVGSGVELPFFAAR